MGARSWPPCFGFLLIVLRARGAQRRAVPAGRRRAHGGNGCRRSSSTSSACVPRRRSAWPSCSRGSGAPTSAASSPRSASTSIVLGFALQNAVGSIISGLLLLFEQPFKLGDWLDTGTDEGPGRRGQLAGRAHRHRQRHPASCPTPRWPAASFTNLSQPAGNHVVTVPTTFGTADRRTSCSGVLDRLGLDLPISGIEPWASTGDDRAEVVRHVDRHPQPGRRRRRGGDVPALDVVRRPPRGAPPRRGQRWLRRSGAGDGGAADRSPVAAPARRRASPAAAAGMRIERWGSGERIQREGEIPHALRFVLRGADRPRHALAEGRSRDDRRAATGSDPRPRPGSPGSGSSPAPWR